MDNNILVISEKEQKAYLPYKYEEIQKIYESPNCKYNSIMEIIQDLYIVPLNKFENFSTARFREAFNLIRYKEKGSIFMSCFKRILCQKLNHGKCSKKIHCILCSIEEIKRLLGIKG